MFYAVWAGWANRMHGPASVGMAAMAQGLYSAVVTAGMTALVERLFSGTHNRYWRVLRCTLATLAALVVSSLAVHWVAGTEEVVMTVLPSWVFGTLYALIYALGLAQSERVSQRRQE